jgi:hypothetical protein
MPVAEKLASGEARAATVEVYLLRVKERLKKWPERSERKAVLGIDGGDQRSSKSREWRRCFCG